MFWDDIKDIKEWMVTISARLTDLEFRKGYSEETMCSSLEESLCRLHDKVTVLMNTAKILEQVELSQKTLDKFEDYMKNVDKLNEMINEFKGCVSIARAAIADKKELDDMRSVLKGMLDSCQKYYNYQKTVSDQYFKIDAIYKILAEKEQTPKPKVKRKPRPKKVTPSS